MATLQSMAIRSNAACDRIEATLQALGVDIAPSSDSDYQPLPRTHKEREMLRAIQLEQIAAMLESIVLPEPIIVQAQPRKPKPMRRRK